jgi:hypothetical protein
MKRFILGLIGFGVLGSSPLLAQTPATVLPVNHREVVAGCEGGSCMKNVCVPECYTKVHKTTVFSSGCEPFCLCYNSFGKLFSHGKCDNGNCQNGQCEDPRTRKFLMKKVVTCEENDIKCVPSVAPGCATTGFRHGHASAAPVVLPAGPTPIGIVTAPAGQGEPAAFVGQKMPQAAVSPR